MKEYFNKSVQEVFSPEASPARAAYALLDAHTPLELSQKYTEEDQKLMRAQEWDYENQELIVNRVKTILEQIDLESFPEKEKEWIQEILWFWYHHAISCAIARYNDKGAAQTFAKKALEFQTEGHPNKITKLLGLLVNDKLKEAEEWAEHITKEPEKSTAAELVDHFKREGFFK